MNPKLQEKKEKLTVYNHARDNAIASVGKIIRYQFEIVQSNPNYSSNLVSYWLNLLPITHDIEEATAMYEYLSDFLANQPNFILGNNEQEIASSAQQLAKIYGEAF